MTPTQQPTQRTTAVAAVLGPEEQRKLAFAKEREERAKRVANSDVAISEFHYNLLQFHTLLSEVEMENHASKVNQELSTAISLLSTAITNINKYMKDMKHEKEKNK